MESLSWNEFYRLAAKGSATPPPHLGKRTAEPETYFRQILGPLAIIQLAIVDADGQRGSFRL